MKAIFLTSTFLFFLVLSSKAQNVIPFDTTKWEINAQAYVLENYKGQDAIYIQNGMATLKDTQFLNGTIEFDVYLTERQAFPGVRFRAFGLGNMESFFLRPHLSGKGDCNQAAVVINGITAWQLYFGEEYSFAYDYNFDGWTHVKLVINDDKGQAYLDYSESPHLSWNLKHKPQEGEIAVGGSFAPMHYANFSIDKNATEIVDFNVKKREVIEGLVAEWEVSDKFDEKLLEDPERIQDVLSERSWGDKISVEENNAANISWVRTRYGSDGNSVLARIKIDSKKDQMKLFEFGYSDRVVVILNGKPMYWGTNKWRTRDYRYLGTVGLFDGVYLDLKKGDNELILAISEDFGGWGVTGKFRDYSGIKVSAD
ncbi:MAG: hypothetical protein JXR03_15720 [Cyclobacteriaceae bacterium]